LATRLSEPAILQKRWFAAFLGAMLIVLMCAQTRSDDGLAYNIDDYVQHPQAASLWENWSDKGISFWSEPPGDLVLTIDYRIRQMIDSRTSYQFGTPPDYHLGNYAPLSKLDWSLNSTWTGFRFGLEKADSAAHFEWLAPIGIGGNIDDYDWSGPDRDPASLSSSPEQWREGQMLDLGYEFRLSERTLGLPVDVWPLVGFRWQRFDMMARDGDQLINDGTLGPDLPPVGYHWIGEMGTFNQQYSIGYLGAQLRGRLETRILSPIAWTLQGDWGYTQGDNIDHHISGYEPTVHRYTMESTHGDCWHVALTVEALFYRDRLSIGVEADYLNISTRGNHRFLCDSESEHIDETWDNGVSVMSHQTWLTAFIRTRF
jgi:hypothetical protein